MTTEEVDEQIMRAEKLHERMYDMVWDVTPKFKRKPKVYPD